MLPFACKYLKIQCHCLIVFMCFLPSITSYRLSCLWRKYHILSLLLCNTASMWTLLRVCIRVFVCVLWGLEIVKWKSLSVNVPICLRTWIKILSASSNKKQTKKKKLLWKHKLFSHFIWDSGHTCTIAVRSRGRLLSDISWRETSVPRRTKTPREWFLSRMIWAAVNRRYTQKNGTCSDHSERFLWLLTTKKVSDF